MKVRRRFVIGAVVVVGILVYAFTILPTSELLGTLSTKGRDAQELRTLTTANAKLREQVNKLNSPQWIESIARNDFGMYPSGSTPYQILPSSPLYRPSASSTP